MLVEQDAGDVFLAALAVIVLHFIFLAFNMLVTWLLRFPEAERKAIILMASQKNLPTAATIISYFDASVGNLGLITIPCIVFYIMQVGGLLGGPPFIIGRPPVTAAVTCTQQLPTTHRLRALGTCHTRCALTPTAVYRLVHRQHLGQQVRAYRRARVQIRGRDRSAWYLG